MNIKELKKTMDLLIKLDSDFCNNDILMSKKCNSSANL